MVEGILESGGAGDGGSRLYKQWRSARNAFAPLSFLAGALCTIAIVWLGAPERFQDRSSLLGSLLQCNQHASLPPHHVPGAAVPAPAPAPAAATALLLADKNDDTRQAAASPLARKMKQPAPTAVAVHPAVEEEELEAEAEIEELVEAAAEAEEEAEVEATAAAAAAKAAASKKAAAGGASSTQQPAPAPCSAPAAAGSASAVAAADAEAELAAAPLPPLPPSPQPPLSPVAPSPPPPSSPQAPVVANKPAAASKELYLPWEPMLTQQEVERGLSYYGTGQRLRAVAAKLLAGKPIKAYTIGGSVTFGKGASAEQFSYASRFFEFLNATFPHKDHVFRNKGMGATNSGIFAACTEKMVDLDADIIVAEFTVNGAQDATPFDHPERLGYEQLMRKLLLYPNAPAVIQLHHWRWWQSNSWGGCCEQGRFWEQAAESQLSVFAQYYDIPIISLRGAVHRLMAEGIEGFKVDKVVEPNSLMREYGVAKAKESRKADYFYFDKTHPYDDGHKVIAELLASTVLRAAREAAADDTALTAAGPVAITAWPMARDDERLEGLPPPMVPGNEVAETTMCAILESFKDAVTDWSKGFKYRPERPEADTFVAQKWAWSADEPGEWVEMEFDSRKKAKETSGAGDEEEDADYNEDYDDEEEEASDEGANVYLTYLRSYAGGMGTATVTCESGCKCGRTTIDGTWTQDASLQQIHRTRVSQHPRCRLRVTVSEKAGSAPQAGHKVSLFGLMVSHFPVLLASRQEQVELMVQKSGN